jgi:hypothetical protein
MATLATRAPAALACLAAAGCGAAAPAGGGGAGPTLPLSGRTPGGAAFRITVASTLDPAPRGARIPAWCPRVDFLPPGRRPTHGAVGCREVRPHVPTGGFAMFCRSSDLFVLLLSTPATRAVSVVTDTGRSLALTAVRGVSDARFWFAHYAARTSPVAVASLEGPVRHVQRYPPIACIGKSPANGLLGR